MDIGLTFVFKKDITNNTIRMRDSANSTGIEKGNTIVGFRI